MPSLHSFTRLEFITLGGLCDLSDAHRGGEEDEPIRSAFIHKMPSSSSLWKLLCKEDGLFNACSG